MTTEEMPEELAQTQPNPQTEPPRRTRAGRKRSTFRSPPKPAWPVRGLWEAAPAEERERAHETCMEILEYWLGRKSKLEVAQDLEVSPLRVWQLSQLALSGMMAGLLAQPRRRVDPQIFEARPDETRAALKKRIAELEKKLSRTEDLVRVLRTAPWAGPGSDSSEKGGSSRASKTRRKRRAKRAAHSVPQQEPTGAGGAPPAHRGAAAGEASPEGGPGSAG